MNYLSEFGEVLSEILFDGKITVAQFAGKTGLTQSEVYRYLRGASRPKLSALIKIADSFNLSIDYLIGAAPYPEGVVFKTTPKFSQTFKKRLDERSLSRYRLSADTEIGINRIDDWYNGKCVPSLEKAVKLSEYFNCSIDSLLGRE